MPLNKEKNVMTSTEHVAITLPDSDGIIEEYAFVLTLGELDVILNLGINQKCDLPSLDGYSFRNSDGSLEVQYKNSGGHRFAFTNYQETIDIIQEVLSQIGH